MFSWEQQCMFTLHGSSSVCLLYMGVIVYVYSTWGQQCMFTLHGSSSVCLLLMVKLIHLNLSPRRVGLVWQPCKRLISSLASPCQGPCSFLTQAILPSLLQTDQFQERNPSSNKQSCSHRTIYISTTCINQLLKPRYIFLLYANTLSLQCCFYFRQCKVALGGQGLPEVSQLVSTGTLTEDNIR